MSKPHVLCFSDGVAPGSRPAAFNNKHSNNHHRGGKSTTQPSVTTSRWSTSSLRKLCMSEDKVDKDGPKRQ